MFAVTYIPDFFLQAALRPQPESHIKPVAIVDGSGNKPLIVQATRCALDAGVHAGMTPTQGLARCPTLVIKTRSAAQEMAAAKALVDCALGFSPYVEATAPDICTMDLRGNSMLGDVLLGQIEALEIWAGKILHALAQLNLAGQVGIARTPLLALHAARAARPVLAALNDRRFLDELPIAVLEPSAALYDLLKTWGIHSVGSFVALGKEHVIERLGAEGMSLFEHAAADSLRPLKIVNTPEVFEEAMDFECDIETVQPLLFVLKRFIEQIALRLESVYLVAEELRFRLIFKQGKDHESIFKVPAPTRQVATLFRLLDTHLETLRADHPIVGLRLSVKPARPAHQQFNLFEAALRDPNQFYQTLARLTGLVGTNRVGVPVVEQTHRPDSFHLEPVSFEVKPRNSADKSLLQVQQSFVMAKNGLALRRFRPPLSAEVQLNALKPAAVKTTQFNRRIAEAAGPWKGCGDWWGDRPWSREEWDVQTSMGDIYRLVCQDEQWFIEGMYRLKRYVELHARSAFSFLRGASLPEHLAEVAARLDLPGVALCDRDGVYGAPRFFSAAKEQGIKPIIGAELTMEDGTVLPVLVESRVGYQNLCRVITRAKLRAEKGKSAVGWNELPEFANGLVALTGDAEGPLLQGIEQAPNVLRKLIDTFGQQNVFVELQRHHLRSEQRTIQKLVDATGMFGLPLLATNGVTYAQPAGRKVQDVFTCIRNHTHLDAAGCLLARNNECFLKSGQVMERLFADLPSAIHNTIELADRLEFSLENLGYEFPRYPVPDGESPDSYLRKQTFAGASQRYREISPRVRAQLDHELALIAKLGFAGYFLIVWDIVNFCRDSNIMIQGRGSAANSAVCYSLGITAVDPVGSDLLFERFLSEGRKGWPDIDLDLPSGDRRERAIQEVYRRYGRLGAAMTANVITYRGRSAAREIGKALNFSNDVLDRFSHLFGDGGFPHTLEVETQLESAGVPGNHARAKPFISLYRAIYGLPRHLGQHSGGMIICQGQLDSIVPLETASMPGRTVAQWDKEDCEDLGIVKVDLLGLGMMSVLQDAIELTHQRGHPVDLAQIPKDDPATFKMMQEADTIGVFQIESRAQMATLPRMKPNCFYDVVIEVAIIRPGPIQGNMVHPYLARRAGKEDIDYIDERLKPVLARTLGVPLFQEQMLKIAMVMADFSGNEAEELRRALSFHRSEERMRKVSIKLRERMQAKGVAAEAIDRIIQSISSFALYGFPESHAISFAILAYGSAYLKTHYAPEFYSCLLNNQPMGFYSPATIVKDAKRHGLQIRPVCATRSDWRCIIEADNSVRLGFCVVRGLREEHARQILAARTENPFQSLDDFKLRVPLNKDEFRTLAEIGALNCFAGHRRDALWQVERPARDGELFAETNAAVLRETAGPLFLDSLFDFAQRQKLLAAGGNSGGLVPTPAPRQRRAPLLPMDAMERLRADFKGMDLTTGPHPMAMVRPHLKTAWRASDLAKGRHGQWIQIAGNVICRQRPGTAKGFVFISLEDESGVSNAVVHPNLFEKQRLVITQEPFLIIEGRLQNVENVVTVRARRITALKYLDLVGSDSHDFH